MQKKGDTDFYFLIQLAEEYIAAKKAIKQLLVTVSELRNLCFDNKKNVQALAVITRELSKRKLIKKVSRRIYQIL